MTKPYSSEFLLMSYPASHWAMNGYGKASLPDGIQRIIGRLHVLGPSMVALVLTFALADSETGRVDAALRDGARPEMKLGGVKKIYQIKYEHIQLLLNDFGERGHFQLLPFQWEITPSKGVVASVSPTAHALLAEVAVTPRTCSCPPGFGLGTSFQARPFHRAMPVV